MLSKMITKISKRPNFYYFDKAIKDGKTAINYSFFVGDKNEVCILTDKIKVKVNPSANNCWGANISSLALKPLPFLLSFRF